MPSPWNPDLPLRAFDFAAKAHAGQKIPASELPYLLHVTSVFAEVANVLAREDGFDGDLAVACAILHDVIEDTEVEPSDLGAEFGPEVLRGVVALSKDPKLPKGEAMADSLRRVLAEPKSVWIVKLADRIVNLAPAPAHWTGPRKRHYREEALHILEALGEASPHLAKRMARRIETYLV
jgi:(p)ppGpp synthase/HD superfamily hydrolase